MNDFPWVPQPVNTVLFPLLNKGVNGKGGSGAPQEKRQTPSPGQASSPQGVRGAVGRRGAWGEGSPGFLPGARWKPAALPGRLAPAVPGLGPAEPEVQGEGAPSAQFHLALQGPAPPWPGGSPECRVGREITMWRRTSVLKTRSVCPNPGRIFTFKLSEWHTQPKITHAHICTAGRTNSPAYTKVHIFICPKVCVFLG